MSSVEDIEKAIEMLPPAELAAFRSWFEAFDAATFDRKIAQDAVSGRLDDLADQALESNRQGLAREL
ncbi:hypothetical protein FNL55_23530 [Tardiphaga sp. vice352]|nr:MULTISPECIES: hypothetical protein [unclassified Tardiphaga]MBC7583386.1 hypothetical protein [Tardiphaga sp.]QDM18675.1 hypothetical protein FNL53_24055 [Tardiphaga sp. vice278]QDM23671.1 hypothetical protein FIU28_22840 [Tardiphaga sp. vice154]QDM28895.1 hypothetical protein FNL56_24280 [Tardiphaga sp. vice304]QDM33995.1 hypothetical protein FNL55_23530 [Tardiphaga sp. vice352]